MPILEHITQSEDYPTLKEVCEGRELPAYEAAAEFAAQTSGELDDLLSQLGGKPGAVQTLKKLEQRGIDFNILCVVNYDVAAHPEECFESLSRYGYIQYIPCLDHLDGTKAEYSLTPDEYLSFLKKKGHICWNHILWKN